MLATQTNTSTQNQQLTHSDKRTLTKQIINTCFGTLNTTNKYLIAIQGCSSSGKSTMADSIKKVLNDNNIETYTLNLDDYYKTYTPKNIYEYDFDNPDALDWDKINGVLRAISEDRDIIPAYSYNFYTLTCEGPLNIVNNRPRVVIIEGIYAFNPINNFKFNICEFDALNTDKKIEKEFIQNEHGLGFKILKIKLTMCKSKSLEVKVERDIVERNKTREDSIDRFEYHVWPAACKWINNVIFKEDIRIRHGSFNEEESNILIEEVVKYMKNDEMAVGNIMCRRDLKQSFEIGCSGECQGEGNE